MLQKHSVHEKVEVKILRFNIDKGRCPLFVRKAPFKCWTGL